MIDRTDGPAVVALGGGHGLAATLRAGRCYAGELTAVVNVADDGGSSGRLRSADRIPAPGDARRCLAALARDDGLIASTLEHRFETGELEGHALGNLLLVGLTDATDDFQAALDEVSRLVDADGRVLPVATQPLELCGVVGGDTVRGEMTIASAPMQSIDQVWVEPVQAHTSDLVSEAIAAADQIVLGPGSVVTSLLATCVVPGIREALSASEAMVVLVANLDLEPAEPAKTTVADHIALLESHGVRLDVAVTDPCGLPLGQPPIPVVNAAVAADGGSTHDATQLAKELQRLLG